MKIVDAMTMRAIDKYCIETLGIRGVLLMEHAAVRIFEEVEKRLVDVNWNSITIVCGVGNNGGDGLALGRLLYLRGYEVKIFIIGNIKKGSSDFKENLNILNNINVVDDKVFIEYVQENKTDKLQDAVEKSHIIVDGIFGTGITRRVEGIYSTIISLINDSGKYVVSIDIPSGINSDNGEIMGVAIKARETITLQLYKKGSLNNDTKEYWGNIKVVDIGIPEKVIEIIGYEEHED